MTMDDVERLKNRIFEGIYRNIDIKRFDLLRGEHVRIEPSGEYQISVEPFRLELRTIILDWLQEAEIVLEPRDKYKSDEDLHHA